MKKRKSNLKAAEQQKPVETVQDTEVAPGDDEEVEVRSESNAVEEVSCADEPDELDERAFSEFTPSLA